MGTVLRIVAKTEGAQYELSNDETACVRIYSDRRVFDDIIASHGMNPYRGKLSKKEYRYALNCAKGKIPILPSWARIKVIA